MSNLTALSKFPCPACGAQAEWNPGKEKLVCPFCGTESPYRIDRVTGQIQELDLVKTLRELPDDQRGWQAEKRSVQCQSCRAVMVFDPSRVGQNCEFCGSPALVDYNEIKAPIRPQSLLPFKVAQTQVREQIRRWYASKWLAPGTLKSRALVDTVHGIYLPYWTFDAHVVCPWRAEAGHYYYTTETYRDNQGRSQTRQVQHVRWENASGTVTHFFDDEPVPGTQGVRHDLLRKIEPFPTPDLVPYDAAMLSGFVVEHYQIVLLDAAERSIQQMHAALQALCAAQVPGDTYRNLEISPTFSDRTFKHVLLPVWLLSYNFGAKAYQVLVNGYTGKMDGTYPISWWKVLGLIVLALVALALFMYLDAG
ncbi:MAG: zinc ribbon domain-containing protein [Vicinamibacteria bacterium]|nr:zinc ribbon domain-containing protein [Vicinamibacteria bacterium]